MSCSLLGFVLLKGSTTLVSFIEGVEVGVGGWDWGLEVS